MKKFLMAIGACIAVAFTFVGCAFCNHNYENGTCTICGYDCDHYDYVDTVCTECGTVCTHVYDVEKEEGICLECGYVCEHAEFKDGTCVTCSTVCKHEYENGDCTICDVVCAHPTYENGECTTCDVVCTHPTYENGECTTCDVVCAHPTYENSICTVCNMECQHNEYEESVCTACGYECTHAQYEEGDCVECGYQDFTWVPADGAVSKYENVVDKFNWLAQQYLENGELPAKEENEPVYVDSLYNAITAFNAYKVEEDEEAELGYAYKDINGDGWKEMLILRRDSYVYAIYTFVYRNFEVAYNNDIGYDYSYLCEEDILYRFEKGLDANNKQIGATYSFMKLVGNAFDGFEYGFYDADGDGSDSDDRIYFKTENGEKTETEKAEYTKNSNHTYDYFISYSTISARKVGLIFNPVIGSEDGFEKSVFDLSSYDAIKATYKKMYTEVANKKFDKSAWRDGKYDRGMIFNSAEDYAIYNSLFCSITQHQYSATSTSSTYGYAEKDLDGDGVNELILMDAYGTGSSARKDIFAIFTLDKEGTPVLLDVYSNLRTAAMDATGKIYVAERILFRHAKDFEYSVYEVKDGKLSVVDCYGYYCDTTTSSTQIKWYKKVNGEEVEVEKAEFDGYFANFVGKKTANSSNYGKFTASNANLSYVALFSKNNV